MSTDHGGRPTPPPAPLTAVEEVPRRTPAEEARTLVAATNVATATAGLFFLRFWRKTRDRLFAIFACAFWLMGVNWLLLAFTDPDAFRPAKTRAMLTEEVAREFATLAQRLLASGWPAQAPVSVVSRAGWPDQVQSDHTVEGAGVVCAVR